MQLVAKNQIVSSRVGGSIGHRSAWLYDLFAERPVSRFDIIEQGAKFGVILHRLQTRYDASSWSNIIVNDFATLCAEEKAWKLTTASGVGADERRLSEAYDAIIVDAPLSRLASDAQHAMGLLSNNGVLYTTEPETPVGEYDELDDDGKAKVDGFNAWIKFVQESQSNYHMAFVPALWRNHRCLLQAVDCCSANSKRASISSKPYP